MPSGVDHAAAAEQGARGAPSPPHRDMSRSAPFASESTDGDAAAVAAPPPLPHPRQAASKDDDAPAVRDAVVVIMRHGERFDAVNDTMEPDTSLTDKGVADIAAAAERVGDALRERRLLPSRSQLRLVSSPFRRCLQTASALERHAGLMTRDGPRAGSRGEKITTHIDPAFGEVFGPIRMKVAEAPPLDGWKTDFPGAVRPEPSITGGELAPAPWGEGVEDAHRRFCTALIRQAESLHRAGGGVAVVATHGDCVDAVIATLRPGRRVYDCQYLGFIVLRQRRPGGIWRIAASDGVSWFDDGEVESPGSDEDVAGGVPVLRTGAAAAAAGSVDEDAFAATAREPSLVTSSTPQRAGHTAVQVERALSPTAACMASPGTGGPDGYPDYAPYSAPRPLAKEHATTPCIPGAAAATSADNHPSSQKAAPAAGNTAAAMSQSSRRPPVKNPSDDEDEDEDDAAAGIQGYVLPAPLSWVLLMLPTSWLTLGFDALRPQRALPLAIALSATVAHTIFAIIAIAFIHRRRNKTRRESISLVKTTSSLHRETFDEAARRRLRSVVLQRRAVVWALIRFILAVIAVIPAAYIAESIDKFARKDALTDEVWSRPSWYFQWILMAAHDFAAALLLPV